MADHSFTDEKVKELVNELSQTEIELTPANHISIAMLAKLHKESMNKVGNLLIKNSIATMVKDIHEKLELLKKAGALDKVNPAEIMAMDLICTVQKAEAQSEMDLEKPKDGIFVPGNETIN